MKYYKLSDARITDNNLQNEGYTIDYIKKKSITSKRWWATQYSAWIPEIAEVFQSKNGEITFTIHRDMELYPPHPDKVKTRLGTFSLDDRGEFGGKLILPNGKEIYGNYGWVFEHHKRVYAIDSMCHCGIAHFKFIRFKKSLDYSILYKSSDSLTDRIDNIYFKSLYQDKDNVYILVSGTEGLFSNSKGDITKLFRIDKNHKFSLVTQYNRDYSYVKNMIICDDKMYLGLDKCVSVTNLKNGEEKLYTFIDKEAEEDILKAKSLLYKT